MERDLLFKNILYVQLKYKNGIKKFFDYNYLGLNIFPFLKKKHSFVTINKNYKEIF